MYSRVRSFGSAMILFTQVSTLLLSVSLNSVTHAQAPPSPQDFQPTVTASSLNAFVEGQGLYILGGAYDLKYAVGQAYMIDLSVSWKASTPVVKQLADGPVAYSMPSALTADSQGWYTMVNGTGYLYDIKTGTWGTSLPASNDASQVFGLQATTDPDTGIIYIPNGHIDSTTGMTSMLTVDLANKKLDTVPMLPQLNTSRLYSTAWSASRKSLLLISNSADSMYSYNPTGGWTHLTPTGDVPSPRVSSCLVPINKGTKMILFGGYAYSEQASTNDIYILDTDTMVWSRGPDVDSESRRDSTACAVSGDYFVAWGGINSGQVENKMTTNSAIVFNIKDNSWSDTFVASKSIDKSTDSRTMYVIGCALGGTVALLIIVAAVAGCIYMMNKKKATRETDEKSRQYPSTTMSDVLGNRYSYPYGGSESKDSLV
ncbi:hypothetical protein EDD11_004797 [Mortierella claussenii]|nr:hypothetical protein EDD11_004797 [Mortierella claussenii]